MNNLLKGFLVCVLFCVPLVVALSLGFTFQPRLIFAVFVPGAAAFASAFAYKQWAVGDSKVETKGDSEGRGKKTFPFEFYISLIVGLAYVFVAALTEMK